ncbi:hypothetical protein KP509_30G046800 [Ceratopteris richardii]|uniref:Uncharacterized protein n=3 Tax=Ceratopteris richardii TaxID=49495 RepID=A0A8T2R3M5_CERRI|nr:hypothetical protein KP509_30G046800 [Ceratopteris richardii]
MACHSSLLAVRYAKLATSSSTLNLRSKDSTRQQLCTRTKITWPLSRSFSVPTIVCLSMEVPDYLPVEWKKEQGSKPLGPRFDMTAQEAINCQLEALRNNDNPHPDYGVEIMYRFAGFDPFQRSGYFGTSFDLGQFERFRRLFHHSTYQVLLGHKEVRILSSLFVNEHCFKQRVWVRGARPNEEEVFEFTLVQRVGGCWDGYWLTQSLLHDGDGISGGIAY